MNIDRKIFSISQINKYIKNIFENDFLLSALFIQGEISNFKKHSSGHMYFSLKDDNGVISCVLFKQYSAIMPFDLENGMNVIIYGRISNYEKTGTYQLYAEFVEPVGIGHLQLAFEQLKNKLSLEGLFDEDFKRNIPQNIKSVAVVTSSTGAVIRDIIKVIKRRDPRVEIAIFPTLVQGDTAPNFIVQAMEKANLWGKADVIILARGGGSMEDLQSFNNEKVARAIFASELPVISAIGHETDFTISDFVADLRASTPSVAGELVSEPIAYKVEELNSLVYQLNNNLFNILNSKKSNLNYLSEKIKYNSPSNKTLYKKEILLNNKKRLNFILESKLKNSYSNLYFLEDKLTAISPLEVMKRGYTIALNENKKQITSINDIKNDDVLELILKDGSLKAKILERFEENND